MPPKFWDELSDIFFTHENLQQEHPKLYKFITKVCEHSKKNAELEAISKELDELTREDKETK